MTTTLAETLADTVSNTIDTGATVETALEDLLNAGIAGFTVEKLFAAVIVAALCLLIIRILLEITDRTLRKTRLDDTLKRLIRGVLRALLVFIGIIVVLGCLDIPVTSLVAVLSVIGLALSLALQNFLSNVAGGLQLLVSLPFKIGDYVEIGGRVGTVVEMTVFYTKLASLDRKLYQLPNSFVVSETIVNYSSEEKRWMELKVSTSYEANTEHVRTVLTKLVDEHPLTISEPAPFVHVNNYGDSAIEYIIRVWCYNKDYMNLYYDLMDKIKPALDKEGIEITYPHLNVHMMS